MSNRHAASSLALFAALLTVAAAAAAGPAATHAATNVPGGTISTDTTWTLAGSPYIVQGSVTVQGTDGADGVTTLTIQPGVTVQFNDNFELIIGNTAPGALVADGDAAGGPAAITFTSSKASPSGLLWDGLQFAAQARASIIRNATLRYSGRGLSFKGAIRVQSPAATRSRSTA